MPGGIIQGGVQRPVMLDCQGISQGGDDRTHGVGVPCISYNDARYMGVTGF